MSDPDLRLAEALRALRPPERDPAFRLALLQRRARRRLQVRLAGLVATGLALTALVVVAGPALDAALSPYGAGWLLPTAILAGSLAISGWSLLRVRRPL